MPDNEAISTIDTLVQASARYRHSDAFNEMIDFIGRFRNYSPYNNLLVRIQNPMAHILLGHLGSDEDQWWPSRSHLGRATVEIEAEATAFVVTQRLGLEGSSAAYVSSYLKPDGQVPASVSFDMIATVAADIKKMAEGKEPTPLTKAERARRRAQ
ncbi:MAG TPA: hypothetical protein VFZ16_21250 [Hyphomicrobiaceae bacterium]|nr:hypothetical protein [Hyphomicrobiaceae bacterium]